METEEERQVRRKARIEEMKKEKKRLELLYKWGVPAAAAILAAIGIGVWFGGTAPFHQEEQRIEEEDGESGGKEDGGTVTDRESNGKAEEDGNGETADAADGQGDAEVAGFMPADGKGEHRSAFGEIFAVVGREVSAKVAAPLETRASEIYPSMGGSLPVGVSQTLGGAVAAQPQEFRMSEETEDFSESIFSQYGIFIDVESGAILAQKEAYERMNPASMTKILTVLVAAEHLTEEDLEQTAPITIDITDYSFTNECSITGYALDEVVTVRDLFYGTILPSGADSALALAIYVAGSHEAFVDMMNEKLAEMGLGATSHFTNCVGLYDEAHYTTAYDMAVMLKAAADNAFCRDVMSAHTYTTSQTEQHPDGLLISNWFLRRIEDRDTHGEVLCGKTGFVDQSGSCAASLGLDSEGKEYLCVTADSNTKWTCIADQVQLYQRFLPVVETEEGGMS